MFKYSEFCGVNSEIFEVGLGGMDASRSDHHTKKNISLAGSKELRKLILLRVVF